ncbi:TetR/AcrR family transcriptional regulator [Paenibacillus sp. 8b26]|uniref:TetR/AcrR family transcriptional regulator n=1 Tax=Paenibacillus sp. 8b26 TaxID=3424133 RepID=UPI003D655A86
MERKEQNTDNTVEPHDHKDRYLRVDAKRNNCALLQSALTVFTTSGVDAPIREIAKQAGVGVGTVYRHFPQRSDLILAVIGQEMDNCAEAATTLTAKHAPGEALALWMQTYVDFILSIPGLAAALHSSDPAYEALTESFDSHFIPILESLLHAASNAGETCPNISSTGLLNAASSLCLKITNFDPAVARDLVSLLIDGLRYRSYINQQSSK